MVEKKENLSPPWITYYKKICAMFANDPEIEVTYEDYIISVNTNSVEKANALRQLLKSQVTMGNIELKIQVLPIVDLKTLFEKAFQGNSIFVKFVPKTSDDMKFSMDYCIFKKEVIQFFNDDISDYYQNYNGLPNQIASEIFQDKYIVGYSIEVPKPNN